MPYCRRRMNVTSLVKVLLYINLLAFSVHLTLFIREDMIYLKILNNFLNLLPWWFLIISKSLNYCFSLKDSLSMLKLLLSKSSPFINFVPNNYPNNCITISEWELLKASYIWRESLEELIMRRMMKNYLFSLWKAPIIPNYWNRISYYLMISSRTFSLKKNSIFCITKILKTPSLRSQPNTGLSSPSNSHKNYSNSMILWQPNWESSL